MAYLAKQTGIKAHAGPATLLTLKTSILSHRNPHLDPESMQNDGSVACFEIRFGPIFPLYFRGAASITTVDTKNPA